MRKHLINYGYAHNKTAVTYILQSLAVHRKPRENFNIQDDHVGTVVFSRISEKQMWKDGRKKIPKNISLICECDYRVFISRFIVALTAVLAQLADSETSNVKVLTSEGAGML